MQNILIEPSGTRNVPRFWLNLEEEDKMFKFTNSTAALAAAALCTGALFASPAAYAKDVMVSYADLDLATVDGQATLGKRIKAAARKACDFNELDTGSRLRSRAATQCFAEATSKLEQRVAEAAAAAKGERLGG